MATSERPNIVLIHCHDLGRWLPCYGMPSVPSPHLDRLAEEGVVFSSACSTAPLCTPARSSLFTGLLPHQNGLMGLTHTGWRYHPGIATLPEMLREHGYHSTLVGLQHEDFDARVLGYDEVHGLGFLPRALEVAYRTRWWLEQSRDDTPYLLTVGMWEVHRPWSTEDYDPSDPETVDVPPFLPDNDDTRRDISEFHGSIRQMDDAVGRILTALDDTPHADNTMVIFTTDHGAAFPRAKSTLYDSGVGVALIVRPPASWRVTPGVRDDIVSHLDIAPTLVELAGGIPSPDLEGISLLSVLRGGQVIPQDRELYLEKTYHDRYDPIRAVRTADAKYIRNFAPGPQLPLAIDLEESSTRRGMGPDLLGDKPDEELYLLRADPWELHNAVDESEHQHLRAHLAERLEHHMHRTADPLLKGDIAPPVVPTRDGGGAG